MQANLDRHSLPERGIASHPDLLLLGKDQCCVRALSWAVDRQGSRRSIREEGARCRQLDRSAAPRMVCGFGRKCSTSQRTKSYRSFAGVNLWLPQDSGFQGFCGASRQRVTNVVQADPVRVAHRRIGNARLQLRACEQNAQRLDQTTANSAGDRRAVRWWRQRTEFVEVRSETGRYMVRRGYRV